MSAIKRSQVLDECCGDLDEALKRARRRFRRVGCCLFGVHDNISVYNNEFVWRLRRVLNRILCNLQFDLETVLNKLRFNAMFIACAFITKVRALCAKAELAALSARHWLGIGLCKQALFSVCVNGVKNVS